MSSMMFVLASQTPPLYKIFLSSTGEIESTCGLSGSVEKYKNGTSSALTIGDIIYNNSSGSTAFNGLDRYWYVSAAGRTAQIDSNGEITDIVIC